MEYLAAVVLFPLLLWALSLGAGLGAERLTGARLPALLLLPLGFGTLIVVSQLTTWFGAVAPLTPLLLVAVAIAGAVASRPGPAARWRSRPRGWWWTVVPVAVTYVVVAAPEIAAGRPTFSGYLLDTTGAVQLIGAEHLLQHGHVIAPGSPAYWTTLTAYFGNGYPTGGHGVLAAVGWLSGQNLIWLYSVFQALELAMLASVLAYLARRAGLGRGAAALAGIVASAPALVYAYALMGSIKEITALPEIALMGALMTNARELTARVGLRAALPFAIAAAATLDAVGLAGSPWVALFAAGWLGFAVPFARWRELRPLLVAGCALVVAVVVLALPVVGPFSRSLSLAKAVSSSNATAVSDPGNLLRPLKFIQTLGVWLGETHRLEPRYVNQTYLLMGVMIVCVALGVAWLVRRRAWGVIAVVAGSLIAYYFLHRHATEWTNAKLLVILSPIVVFVGMVGALGLMQSRRVEGLVLTIAAVVGVAGSDALLYHGTNLAPTARYQQLLAVGDRFRGTGPTLVTDFDEYAIYALRNAGVDGPAFAYSGAFEFVPGVGKAYGHSYDLDSLALPTVERFQTIVMRRSPGSSRPPSNFYLASQGRYYSVWRRSGPAPLVHLGAGAGGLWQPAAVLPCRQIRAAAAQAQRAGASLAFSARPENAFADLATAAHTPAVALSSDAEGRPQLAFGGPARVETPFYMQAPGNYAVWLGGDVDRPLKVEIDGHTVGAPAAQSGGDGTAIYVATVALGRGRHTMRLVRGGGDLRPDDAGSTVIDGFILEPAGAERERVQRIAPSAWRSLCGRSLDWLEAS
jgi:hypothetical protein